MAAMNGYAGNFIGNDFIRPAKLTRPNPAPTPKPISTPTQSQPITPLQKAVAVPAYMPKAEASPVQASPKFQVHTLPSFISLRTGLFVLAALVVIVGVVVSLQTTAWHTVSSETAKLEKDVSLAIHGTPSFVMPPHSVVANSNELASDIDAVEAQPINVTVGSTTVSVLPTTIAQWIKVSAGPKAGTKVMSVNMTSLSNYITTTVNQNSQGSNSLSSIAQAKNQIAKELFACGGINVTI